MICAKCGRETETGRFCQHCGAALGASAPVGGLATLRIVARKHLPVWMMVVQPLNFFMGYKVYISVGDQEYVLKSKKRQMDIQVVPGVHFVRISSVSKKRAKVMKGIGMATQLVGGVLGNGSTYVLGSVMEDVGGALTKEGRKVGFEAGEFMEYKVKLNFMGKVVEDKKK